MLSISSSSVSPIFTYLTNKKKEGFGPRWVLPCVYFMSLGKGNSMVFSYLESLKIFDKEDSTMDFFVNLVPRVRKCIKRYLQELF
jgi:hypothetical protein